MNTKRLQVIFAANSSKLLASLLLFIYFISAIHAQPIPIDVTEQTIKIGATHEQENMFGFAAGDQIIFHFQETNNKEVKEVEILEYPGQSRFSDFRTSKIEGKTLDVLKQGVYIFRFKNSALSARICKIHIQRIPASTQTASFNTAVQWIEKQDTSWNSFAKDVLIGYDTTYQQKAKLELISSTHQEEIIMDRSERVKSKIKTALFFTLPINLSTPLSTRKTIGWAYWIGVGEEADEAWRKNTNTIKNLVKAGARYYTTPLGAYIIGEIFDFFIPIKGKVVNYSLTDLANKDLYFAGAGHMVYDQGMGVAGYKKFTHPRLLQGTYFINMYNGNSGGSIDVNVKVVSLVETKQFENKPYTDTIVKSRYEKQLFKEPVITTKKVPITGF